MKKVLLVCTDRYPNGDAGAVRIHVFAKMMQSLGYEPTVVGMGVTTDFTFQKEDGISYISLRSPSAGIIPRMINLSQFHKRLKRLLFSENMHWDVIMLSTVPQKALFFLKRYAEENAISLIHDSVEWYSPEQFPFGKLHPNYIRKDRFNRVLVEHPMKVIAISSYLQKHFRSRGMQTVRIPVLMDVQSMSCEKYTDAKKTVFAYAGSPGKKDYIRTIVEGFSKFADDKREFELRLIGITRDQLVSLCDVDENHVKQLGEHLQCLGRISRDQVLKELSQADFTVLIRSEKQRYAMAGFPTKFVESLTTATPVVANLTSDLSLYLKDGENGFVVESCSAEALAETLDRAMNLSTEQKSSMQAKARHTAENKFDYSLYETVLAEFINV